MQADLNLRWAHITEGIFSDVAARPTDTVNPLYTDTRYNDKIRYNDNLSVTKPLLKKRRLMRNYAKTLQESSSSICFGYFLETPQRGNSKKYPKHMLCEEIRIKQGIFIPIILFIKASLQQSIHYNCNIFGNKCCRYNERSLYQGDSAYTIH